MNTPHSNPHFRRVLTFVALAATLGLSAVSLTQCRLVDGTVGPNQRSSTTFHGSGTHGRSRCEHQCQDRYKECKRAEDIRHKAALRACDKNAKCKKAEDEVNDNNLKQCTRDLQRCRKDCDYREGSGKGGR